jgi:hypothetical protein
MVMLVSAMLVAMMIFRTPGFGAKVRISQTLKKSNRLVGE